MSLQTNATVPSTHAAHHIQHSLDTRSVELATARLDEGQLFGIRSASSHLCRQSASQLVERRYAWRGYSVNGLPHNESANRITLTASHDEATIGTITVGLDGPEGLNCEDAFAPEIRAMRDRGLSLCEFTKLAVDPVCSTKRVLAALFHVAYIVAHSTRPHDILLMEVNPRHVRYYERMFGAQVAGEARIHNGVNAPAVLLAIPFSHMTDQVAKFAGRPELAASSRTLYPLFFTRREQDGIVGRLRGARNLPAPLLN